MKMNAFCLPAHKLGPMLLLDMPYESHTTTVRIEELLIALFALHSTASPIGTL